MNRRSVIRCILGLMVTPRLLGKMDLDQSKDLSKLPNSERRYGKIVKMKEWEHQLIAKK